MTESEFREVVLAKLSSLEAGQAELNLRLDEHKQVNHNIERHLRRLAEEPELLIMAAANGPHDEAVVRPR